jgi:hypothetical protein
MATAPQPDHHNHDHDHDHHDDHRRHEGAGYGSGSGTEAVLPPSTDGSVVLDVGGDVGALVLHTDATLDGVEIDLYRSDSIIPYVHSAVRARRLTTGTRFAAVYPDLPAGDYVIAAHGSVPPTAVTVDGGRVTEAGG